MRARLEAVVEDGDGLLTELRRAGVVDAAPCIKRRAVAGGQRRRRAEREAGSSIDRPRGASSPSANPRPCTSTLSPLSHSLAPLSSRNSYPEFSSSSPAPVTTSSTPAPSHPPPLPPDSPSSARAFDNRGRSFYHSQPSNPLLRSSTLQPLHHLPLVTREAPK